MAKKQKKPTGLIIATSVLAVLFTLSAVAIGLFVGFNSDTVLAAIKNKETSFALTSELENVTAEKDKEIENVTAEKNAELALAELDKEQALIDAEAEKTEAVESAKKQTLLDRHVLGISNVNELIGMELNSDTWSSVYEKIEYRPIEEDEYYGSIKFEINQNNKDAFCQYLLGLNLEEGEEYTILTTSNDYRIYAKENEGNIALCFGNERGAGFGVDENGEFLGGTYGDEFNKIYGEFSNFVSDDEFKIGFYVRISSRFEYVAENQAALDGWGTFLFDADIDAPYTIENVTPQFYYYTQPLELPGVHVAFDDVDRLAEFDAYVGLSVTFTFLINGEEVQYNGVVGLTEWGAFLFMINDDYFEFLMQSDLLLYDYENEIGIFAEEQIGGASLVVGSETAIETFVIESIVIGDEILEPGD